MAKYGAPFKMKGFSGFGNESPLQQKSYKDDPRYKAMKAEQKKFGMGYSPKEYHEEMSQPVVKGGKTTTGKRIKGKDMGKGYKDVRSTPRKAWDKLTQYGQGIKGAFTKGKTAFGEYQRELTHDKIAGLAKSGAGKSATRIDYEKHVRAADRAGKKTFKWVNPNTGKTETHTTKKK